jgi:glycolate oxidase iron-sulfur subunit
MRMALQAARLARPFAGLLQRIAPKEIAAMLALAPTGILLPKANFAGAGTAATTAERRKRVILLAGCAQQVLRPSINDATIRLLARRGGDVEVAAKAGCCGALLHHMGREEAALAMARQNIDAWIKVMDKGSPVDAVIINASGCGTTVKDYGHMLKRDPQYAEPAARISQLTRDVTEFLAGYNFGPPQQWSRIRVAYHSACSMQHGQRVIQEPVRLLRNAGFSVVSVPEGHLCCGSAGTYNILQPEISGQLRDRKVANIRSVRPDVVATGNIGCVAQLQASLGVPIVHTVELLDWAHGGPAPSELESLDKLVYEVPEQRPTAAVT